MSTELRSGEVIRFYEVAVGGPMPDHSDARFYRLWSAQTELGAFRFNELDQPPKADFHVSLVDCKGSVPPENTCKVLIEQALRPRMEHWNEQWDRSDCNPVTFSFSGTFVQQENFAEGAGREPTIELVIDAKY